MFVQVICAGAINSEALTGDTHVQMHTETNVAASTSVESLSANSFFLFSTSGIVSGVIFWIVYLCLAALVGHYYHTRPRTGIEFEQKDFSSFQSGLFSIFDDMNICLWSFVCLPIRWGENTSLIGVMNFFLSFFLCIIGCGISQYTGFFWLFMILMFTIVRYKFRQSFAMETGCGSICTDCLSYAFMLSVVGVPLHKTYAM